MLVLYHEVYEMSIAYIPHSLSFAANISMPMTPAARAKNPIMTVDHTAIAATLWFVVQYTLLRKNHVAMAEQIELKIAISRCDS